jgi:hypothetical protein
MLITSKITFTATYILVFDQTAKYYILAKYTKLTVTGRFFSWWFFLVSVGGSGGGVQTVLAVFG